MFIVFLITFKFFFCSRRNLFDSLQIVHKVCYALPSHSEAVFVLPENVKILSGLYGDGSTLVDANTNNSSEVMLRLRPKRRVLGADLHVYKSLKKLKHLKCHLEPIRLQLSDFDWAPAVHNVLYCDSRQPHLAAASCR